jgi:hypothetical protein
MTPQGFGVFCSICKNKNESGALICKYCGAPLETNPAEYRTTRQVDEEEGLASVLGEEYVKSLPPPPQGMALYVFGNAMPISVRSDEEFVIGRSVAGSPGPLVDLAEFDGFALGVSRQHVMIRPARNGYEVIDLNSRNGTWLNEHRLAPDRPYPLNNRAQLRLGKMRLIVVFQPPSKSGGAS